MALRCQVELLPFHGSRAGNTLLSSPQPSDETLIAEVDAMASDQLFCHRHQTDQLLVLRGAIDFIVVQDRRLRRIHLRADRATWLRIPPGIPHAAINRGVDPALVVNAVLRHGPRDPRDYQPRSIPAAVAAAWSDLIVA